MFECSFTNQVVMGSNLFAFTIRNIPLKMRSQVKNIVELDVQNDNVVSTLSNVVHINVELHNVDSTLFAVIMLFQR